MTGLADDILQMDGESAERRIAEALDRLTWQADRTFRLTPQGELIEALGCILTGRKSAWWPESSTQPDRRSLA